MIQTIGSLVCNRQILLYRAFWGRWSRRAGNFWIVQLKLVNILEHFNLYIRAFTYYIHVLLQPAASLLSIIHFHLCSKSSVEVSCVTLRSRTLCAIQKSPRQFLLRAIGYIGQYLRVPHNTVEFPWNFYKDKTVKLSVEFPWQFHGNWWTLQNVEFPQEVVFSSGQLSGPQDWCY